MTYAREPVGDPVQCMYAREVCEEPAVYEWTWQHRSSTVEVLYCAAHLAEKRSDYEMAARGELTGVETTIAWWTPYSVRSLP